MYTFRTRIRYSETGRNGRLSMPGLLALFQDAGYQHAADRGLGIAYTAATRHTYYLLSWRIEAYRMPEVGEEVTVSTWFSSFSGPIAKKSLSLRDRDGGLLAAAATDWVYLNIDSNIPADPPAGLWEGDALNPPLEMEPCSRRLSPPGARGKPGEAFLVSPDDTDTNRHVNNVRFVSLAARAAGISGETTRLRVEYRRQAHTEDLLVPSILTEERGTTVSLSDPSGSPYAVFFFGK